MTFDPLSFKLPGEIMYKGVWYMETLISQRSISEVLEWHADPRDIIIIASYPKTGELSRVGSQLLV